MFFHGFLSITPILSAVACMVLSVCKREAELLAVNF